MCEVCETSSLPPSSQTTHELDDVLRHAVAGEEDAAGAHGIDDGGCGLRPRLTARHGVRVVEARAQDLEALHEADAAHGPDEAAEARVEPLEARAQHYADGRRVVLQSLRLNDVEDSKGDGARDRLRGGGWRRRSREREVREDERSGSERSLLPHIASKGVAARRGERE